MLEDALGVELVERSRRSAGRGSHRRRPGSAHRSACAPARSAGTARRGRRARRPGCRRPAARARPAATRQVRDAGAPWIAPPPTLTCRIRTNPRVQDSASVDAEVTCPDLGERSRGQCSLVWWAVTASAALAVSAFGIVLATRSDYFFSDDWLNFAVADAFGIRCRFLVNELLPAFCTGHRVLDEVVFAVFDMSWSAALVSTSAYGLPPYLRSQFSRTRSCRAELGWRALPRCCLRAHRPLSGCFSGGRLARTSCPECLEPCVARRDREMERNAVPHSPRAVAIGGLRSHWRSTRSHAPVALCEPLPLLHRPPEAQHQRALWSGFEPTYRSCCRWLLISVAYLLIIRTGDYNEGVQLANWRAGVITSPRPGIAE